MSDAEYWVATTRGHSDRVVHTVRDCALKCGAFDVRPARDDELERLPDCEKCQRDIQHNAGRGEPRSCPLCDGTYRALGNHLRSCAGGDDDE